ncbi:DNA-binding protein [Xanthobacter sp. DSM 24535]|jgi:predicted DNA-binding transcriptional regulator AlpA|uniref:helix-turn-helix transcriptional regulator n=1 Tax=Roseixanthobacter psychrophilus TaxID=3119917 RepID=UPI00372ABDA1
MYKASQSGHETLTKTKVDDPLVSVDMGASLLGMSVASFWRRVADGTIPEPLKLGRLSRWPRSEILTVIEKAKAARTAGGSHD